MKYRIAKLKNGKYQIQYQDLDDKPETWWVYYDVRFLFQAKKIIKRKIKEKLNSIKRKEGLKVEKIIEEFEV